MIPMSARDRERWNVKYARRKETSVIEPDEWLVEAIRLVEASSDANKCERRAIDIACR